MTKENRPQQHYVDSFSSLAVPSLGCVLWLRLFLAAVHALFPQAQEVFLRAAIEKPERIDDRPALDQPYIMLPHRVAGKELTSWCRTPTRKTPLIFLIPLFFSEIRRTRT